VVLRAKFFVIEILDGGDSIGLLNGLDNLLSALYSFPGGYASDRMGYKRALLFFNLIAMAGYLVVVAVPRWQAVILGAILFISWTAVSLPATMEMLATVLPKNKRTMGVSMHSLVRRIPMALGPVIGGALIGALGEAQGVRLAFAIAFVLAGVSLALQQILIEDEKRSPHEKSPSVSYGLGLLNKPLRNLLVSDILVRFCEQIPYAFVVVWCVTIHKITPLQFGLLTTIEMAVAMLAYIPVAYLADKSVKKPFVVATFGFFTLFPLVLMVSQSLWMMTIAFIIRGLKEFGEPTRKALIMDLAPDGRKAATFGLYYLIRDVVVSIAAFGGALLWDASTAQLIVDATGMGGALMPVFDWIASPRANFLAACGFGLAGTLYFILFGRDLIPAEIADTTMQKEIKR